MARSTYLKAKCLCHDILSLYFDISGIHLFCICVEHVHEIMFINVSYGEMKQHNHCIVLYRLQFDCQHNLKIPMIDADGDRVKCRWAVGKECDSVCKALPFATLDEVHLTPPPLFDIHNTYCLLAHLLMYLGPHIAYSTYPDQTAL